MSLLLDALKKASKDKLQIDEQKEANSVSLELDLNENEEDFPQVAIKPHKNILENKGDFIDEISHREKNKLYTENTHIKLEIEAIDDKVIENKLSEDDSQQAENIGQYSEPERNKQALSALINKSKAYQKSQHKKNIGLVVLAFLVTIIILASYWMYLNAYQNDVIYYDGPAKASLVIEGSQKLISRLKPEIKNAQVELKKEKIKPIKTKVKENKVAEKNSKTTKIIVKKSTVEDPIDVLLQTGYQDFQQGNYRVSLETYQRVLRQEKYNRDALLGAAANHKKLEQNDLAKQAYQQILKIDPNDSYALAAMAMLSEVINKYKNESEIKSLLRQQPNKAHLHFALGTFYSNKNQWPAAQSAYFNAWALENKNADYAYNLAVSLDHIRQVKDAIKFYRIALKYNIDKNISRKNIRQRINHLQQKAEK